MFQKTLNSGDHLTSDLLEAGIVTWDDIVRSVQCFHYGRNSDRNDLTLVWYERKGSCSSKHAFLKQISDLNGIPNVKLILAFYRMNDINTPGIGSVLMNHDLEYIPEAHCYLTEDNIEIDITTIHSSFENYKDDIIVTKEIQANDVIENKVNWHKEFIRNWMIEKHIMKPFEEIWKIREMCIAQLEKRIAV